MNDDIRNVIKLGKRLDIMADLTSQTLDRLAGAQADLEILAGRFAESEKQRTAAESRVGELLATLEDCDGEIVRLKKQSYAKTLEIDNLQSKLAAAQSAAIVWHSPDEQPERWPVLAEVRYLYSSGIGHFVKYDMETTGTILRWTYIPGISEAK